MKIVDNILSIVDSGSAVALFRLDISAAFDTVSRRKLLARLEHDFSIDVVALESINSYLSERTFFVHVGRSSSVVAHMCAYVPQGSVLWPILFSAYVSPIERLIELYGVSYHKYADDNQLYTALTVNPDACIDRLESCSAGFATMVLRERSAPKPRHIRSLLLRYSAKVTTCRQAVVNQSCRMLHRRVRQTKNTWCYTRQRAHVRGPYQRRGSLM